MDRLSWTELDVKAARREWAVETYALADPVVLPHHLRELSARERHTPSPSRRKGKHASDDQEGSRVMRVDVGTVVKVAAVVALVVVGVRVVRSLMP